MADQSLRHPSEDAESEPRDSGPDDDLTPAPRRPAGGIGASGGEMDSRLDPSMSDSTDQGFDGRASVRRSVLRVSFSTDVDSREDLAYNLEQDLRLDVGDRAPEKSPRDSGELEQEILDFCSIRRETEQSSSSLRRSVSSAMNLRRVLTNESLVMPEEKGAKRVQAVMDLQEHAMRRGSKLLLVAFVSGLCLRAWVIVSRTALYGECNGWAQAISPEVRAASFSLEVSWCLAGLVLPLCCLWRPHRAIYLTAVLWCLIYTQMVFVLPTEPTCDDDWRLAQCLGDTELWDSDCGLQGSTATIICIMAVCFWPHVIPSFDMMSAMWLYVGMFLVISLLQFHALGYSRYFSVLDIVITVALLCSATLGATYKKFVMEGVQLYMDVLRSKKKEATVNLLGLLQDFLPSHVIAPMLQSPCGAIAEQIDCASVLFIKISDFNQHTQSRSPCDLLEFLNNLFTQFDDICMYNDVTKIETVGEEYVAAVGVLPADRQHALTLGHHFVLSRLLRAAASIFELQTSEGVSFKMGLHTGPVVAGVIGQKLPRFRLFGDTVNMAARMMQKGVDGELQFGAATRRVLPNWAEAFPQGEIEMKGKGSVTVYHLKTQDGTESMCWERDSGHSKFSIKSSRTSVDSSLARIPLEGILSEVRSLDEVHTGSRSVSSFFNTKVRSLRRSRTPREECPEEWLCQFYLSRSHRQLAPRADRRALILVAATVCEAASVAYLGAGQTCDLYGLPRLWIFFMARLLVLAGIFWWRCAGGNKSWIRRSPRTVELWRLFYLCACTVMMLISYSVLPRNPIKIDLDMTTESLREVLFQEPYRVQLWPLMFILWYATVVTDLQLRCMPSLFYVAFTLSLLSAVMTVAKEHALIDHPTRLFATFVVGVLGIELARVDEATSLAGFELERETDHAKERFHTIMNRLMPPLVMEQLNRALNISSPRPEVCVLPSHYYARATVAQSDLVGFTKLASTQTPAEVVDFVSDIFGVFDSLTDRFQIYKIETVGDAYIAGQAVRPLTPVYRPLSVVQFGMEMIRATADWSKRKGIPIDCRVGVHTGECTGGIVGMQMRRYHLFGTLLAGVEALESTAPVGRVHISEACRKAVARDCREADLPRDAMVLEARSGAPLVTSKGDVLDVSEVGGGPTFIVVSCLSEPLVVHHPEQIGRAFLETLTTFSATCSATVGRRNCGHA